MSHRPSDQNIDQLAARAQDGEERAFVELITLTQQRAFSLAFRLMADSADARDVTQEAFIKVWEKLHRYDRGSRFEPWLYRIITNTALDKLRARKRWWTTFLRKEDLAEEDPSPSVDPEEAHINADLASIIKSVAGSLPEKQRLVFLLRDLQDCSVAEVSSILRMSPESVKTNLHFARKRIREIMQQEYSIRKEQP